MTAAGTTLQLVVFSLGDEEFAAPVTSVQEIIEHRQPRTVASEVPWLRGVISLRGRIIPVCDLATRLGTERAPRSEAKVVVVEAGGQLAGVVVDAVSEVLTIDADLIEELPVAQDGIVEGIARVDDRLIVLLNLDGVLAEAPVAAA